MHRRAVVLVVLGLVSSAGCRPLVDGGWQGTATCNGDAFPVSAIFNEDSDGELEGTVFIENFLLFGDFIAKGTIENGARDPDDGSYDFKLESNEDDTPEFDVEMEYADDEFEELEGTVDVLNEDGSVADTCQLDLERVSVND